MSISVVIGGQVEAASQATLLSVKTKTDTIPADIGVQLDTNIPAIKSRVDMQNAYLHMPLYPMRGAAVAGTWAYVINAAMYAYSRDLSGADVTPGHMTNTTAAINDEYKYPKVALAAGDYSLEIYYWRYPTRAILTVQHGAAVLGTIDMYNAGSLVSVLDVINFTIGVDTVADLRYIAASKNASSSAYGISIQSAILWRRS